MPKVLRWTAPGTSTSRIPPDNRVRKVSASTGLISTVAGNGTSGYIGDGIAATSAGLKEPIGVALDGAGNIYIADIITNASGR